MPCVFILVPFLRAVSAIAVGSILGLDENVIAIDQRDLIVHQQVAGRIRIGFLGVNIEIVNQINNILVERLSYHATIKQRVLGIQAPLRPNPGACLALESVPLRLWT